MAKEKTQKEKNSEAYATVYATQEVIVAQVTSSVYGVLSLTDADISRDARNKIMSQVTADVQRQIDSLITRLQKILD